jgi:hypothetical protein
VRSLTFTSLAIGAGLVCFVWLIVGQANKLWTGVPLVAGLLLVAVVRGEWRYWWRTG